MKKYQLFGLTIILTIFLLGTISAGIYKDVQDEKNIKIKDKYWIDVFGWFAEDVAHLKLLTPLDNKVPRGYQKVAEYEVNSIQDLKILVSKMELYNLNDGMKEINRQIDYKIKSYEDVVINDYESVCKEVWNETSKNNTQECTQKLIGNHTEQRVVWNDLSKTNFNSGEKIIVGLFTDVQKGDKVEWIPTFQIDDTKEIRIEEWATWTEDLNTDLILYYNFNENSGEVIDLTGNGYDGTNNGATYGVTGKIDNAYEYVRSQYDYVNFTDSDDLAVDPFSVSLWIKADNVTNRQKFVSLKKDYNFHIVLDNGNLYITLLGDGGDTLVKSNMNTGTWYHIVYTKNGSSDKVYVNNVEELSTSLSGSDGTNRKNFIGAEDTGGHYFDGIIDEFGLWNRTLTSTEVSDLYNGGDGITYTSDFGPSVTLNSPIEYENLTSQSVAFNCTASGDVNLVNVSFYLDGVINETNSSGLNNTDYIFEKTLIDGDYNWTCEATDNESHTTTADYRYFEIDSTDPVISASINETILYADGDTILLNTTVIDNNLDSVWYSYNGTNTTIDGAINNTLNQTTITTTTSALEIIVYANDTFGQTATPVTLTLTTDTTLPQINISYPTGTIDYHQLNTNETLNVTITDTNLDTCWYNYNGTNITFSCTNGTLSTEYFNLTISSNSQSITVYANDTLGNENSTIQNWSYKILENERTFTSSIFETEAETYSINVSANSSLTSAKLYWNDTNYTMTEESEGYWTYSRDMPLGTGDYPFYFIFTYAEETITSINSTQEVNLTLFTPTNATYSDVFLNLSFKDENDLSWINASIPTSTFIYYLGSGSVNKTLSFSNNTNNYYYAFSGTTGDKDLYVIPEVQYRQVSDYPQRIWQPAIQTYNSTQEDKILYLLSSNDGIYVTYQVLTAGENPIQGVSVVSTRQVSGETVQIGAGETDAAGTITFWMNPDFQHTTTFNKEGYDEYVFTHYPTQASYTITLGSQVEEEASCTNGISYTIKPSENFLWQNQVYDFNFTLSSSYWNLTSIQITLKDEDGVNLGSDSSTNPSGATLSINDINISNNTVITMTYLYELDPDEDDGECGQISSQREWITQSITGREYSIWYLSEQAKLYISAGMWGIDDFGKTVISFIIIVLLVGGISMRYGIASEGAIMGILFGIVYLLDFGLNLIPKVQIGDIVSIDHYLTFITFIILFIIILKEEMKA